MIALGVDPGAATGLLWLTIPDERGRQEGRYLAHRVVTKPQRRVREDHAGQELRYVERLAAAIAEQPLPDLIVLERPADGARFWSSSSGSRTNGRQRGTDFAIGIHYLSALIAARQAARTAAIVTYPVLGTPDERGWLPRKVHRDHILRFVTAAAAECGAPPGMKDHCLMALGVLRHHLTTAKAEAA